MKKLKDIFYDMNDIMVALIIIAIAAFVIVGKIDTILNYPSTLAAEIKVPEEKPQTHYAEEPQNTSGDAVTQTDPGTAHGNGDSQQNAKGNKGSQGETPVNYSVYIEYGATGEQIADILIKVGLLDSRQQFYDAVAAAGADAKLQAGNFIIPSNSTPAEVVKIITE